MNTKSFYRVVSIAMVVIMSLTPINITEGAIIGPICSDNTKEDNTDKKDNVYKKDNIEEDTVEIDKELETNQDNNEAEVKVLGAMVINESDFEIGLLSAETEETEEAQNVDEAEGKKGRRGALDWFDEVQYIFAREVDAYITDIDTGKSFWVKRTFGTNHADIEPLTKEDSDIIKDIWNGWSWERRAVVVQVGEDILAGAMSAMPHAGLDSAPAVNYVSGRSAGYGYGQNLDAVKNNGADGVMDLHFKNSRTHTSNRRQSSMQNMVSKADQYIRDMGY